jgi:hypothetical protein
MPYSVISYLKEDKVHTRAAGPITSGRNEVSQKPEKD